MSYNQIVILRDIGWKELRAVVDYMYRGEINVDVADLQDVLRAAEALKIRGLVDFATGGAIDTAAAAEQGGVGRGEPRGVSLFVIHIEDSSKV